MWVICIPNPCMDWSFSVIPGNKCCHGSTFVFLELFLLGSLHSKLLHELELIRFSAISGNKCLSIFCCPTKWQTIIVVPSLLLERRR